MPADDDAASGPPPHPLDRLWFHPSELGKDPGGNTAAVAAPPRVWAVAAVALLVGISGTLGVTLAAGGLRSVREQPVPARVGEVAPVDPDAVATLVTTVGRSIVTLTVAPAGGGDATRAGSGVVVRAGQVLTAAHLLAGGVPGIVTVGGQVGTATVRGVDPETDLALLAVEGVELVPARLGTGDGLRIGQRVAALGAGPAPHRWVSTGVISGLDRMSALAGNVQGAALIETDVRFDDTAGGGALLDDSGAVVGILTGADRHAVPIDVARDVAAQLDLNGRAAHGWSGVVGADALDRPGGGVRIRAVVAGSPAEAAGLQAGDVVLAVGDATVDNVGALVAAVRRLKPGDPVEITVIRAGTRVEVALSLGQSVVTPSDWLTVA